MINADFLFFDAAANNGICENFFKLLKKLLAAPHGMWDLSFLLGIRPEPLASLDPQGSPKSFFFLKKNKTQVAMTVGFFLKERMRVKGWKLKAFFLLFNEESGSQSLRGMSESLF